MLPILVYVLNLTKKMGSEQSTADKIVAREREFYERVEREREEVLRLARTREHELQEKLRLERERNLYRRPREDLSDPPLDEIEAQQLQEALRRSLEETQQRHLYPNLNNGAGSSRNETYQTTAAPLAVNHSRFQPSAPLAPQATTSTAHASAAAPHEKKVFKRKDDDIMCCKTCKKPYGDRIFQCKNGHSACHGCWCLNLPCGVCRGPITNTRNFDLENYITANLPVKCPNAADGCILTFKKSELAKHQKDCPFKELKCPALGNCDWIGKISQLSTHFDEVHPHCRQANVDTEMSLPNVFSEYNSLQLIKMGVYNFLLFVKLSKREQKLYMAVHMIGTKTSASKWKYEIHVHNKKEPHRKYQYDDSCLSYAETPGSFHRCAILPLPYAKSFVNDKGNFTYKICIKKNLKQKPN